MWWNCGGLGAGIGGGWMIFGAVMMVLFWGFVIWLFVWGIRKLTEHDDSRSTVGIQNPLEVAKARYARGEISREEFEQIKRDLS